MTLDQAMPSQIQHQSTNDKKTEKLDCTKIKNFCFNEHHYKSKKLTTEIYGNHIADKKLASRTYKELLQLNDQKTNQCLKMGKESEQTYFQRMDKNGQQTHETMLSFINLLRNANKNPNEIPLHTYQEGIIKEADNNKCC